MYSSVIVILLNKVDPPAKWGYGVVVSHSLCMRKVWRSIRHCSISFCLYFGFLCSSQLKFGFRYHCLFSTRSCFLVISSYSKVPRMFQLLLLRLPRSRFPRTRLSEGSGEAINPHVDAFVVAPTLELRCISNIPYETWTPRLYSF